MAGERLAVGSAERHGIALRAGPFTEIVVRRQNLPVAIDEGAHRLGVTPAEGGAPNIPRDAGQGVVVDRGPDLARLVLCFAGGSASALPDILPAVLPYAIGHVVEALPPWVVTVTSVRPARRGYRYPSPPFPGRCPLACRRYRERAALG